MVKLDKKKKKNILNLSGFLRRFCIMTTGFFIFGLYINHEQRFNRDGQPNGYTVLVSAGVDSYRISVDDDPGPLCMGDPVRVKVRPRAYNGVVYYNGDAVEPLAD